MQPSTDARGFSMLLLPRISMMQGSFRNLEGMLEIENSEESCLHLEYGRGVFQQGECGDDGRELLYRCGLCSIRSKVNCNKRDVGFITGLPGASEKLKIFIADLREPESFNAAIEGCKGVFHVACTMDSGNKEPVEDVTKRGISGALGMLEFKNREESCRHF
ncbi:hypothetical protein V6N13_079773 [Hibiscus sabdariffa]